MEVIIIDSITHEWDGKGGCLEIQTALGGRYQDWATVTPRHQAFINAILQSKCHIITTVRRKQDYDMTKNESGRTTVTKVGLKEVTREGFEYEVTTNLELDQKHHATASKDRTGLFMGQLPFIPSEETGRKILEWCESGAEVIPVVVPGKEAAIERLKASKEIKDLQATFTTLSTELKTNADVVRVKDEMKAKLTTPAKA
jgi:hypothetical protein